MTIEEGKNIRELREMGFGYRIISQKTGIDRDRVRYFCKTNGLDGNIRQMKKEDGIFCPQCGSRIEQKKGRGPKRRFCSEKCRRDYWKDHKDEGVRNENAMYHIVCSCCKKEFVSYGNRNRKYCSMDCYIKARFWQEKVDCAAL